MEIEEKEAERRGRRRRRRRRKLCQDREESAVKVLGKRADAESVDIDDGDDECGLLHQRHSKKNSGPNIF